MALWRWVLITRCCSELSFICLIGMLVLLDESQELASTNSTKCTLFSSSLLNNFLLKTKKTDVKCKSNKHIKERIKNKNLQRWKSKVQIMMKMDHRLDTQDKKKLLAGKSLVFLVAYKSLLFLRKILNPTTLLSQQKQPQREIY